MATARITELDVSLRPRWGAPVPERTPELRAAHAARYGDIFRMFRRNRDAVCENRDIHCSKRYSF
jgi:hypothetical protein